MSHQAEEISIKDEIRGLVKTYADSLKSQIDARIQEMEHDDKSHFLIYRVLGVTDEEGRLIDIYQNKGRFLYKYAGSFLEQAAKLCFKKAYPDSGSRKITNTRGTRPRTFEIDCLVESDAIEIKWRDATTDGDHITKEHTRIQTIHDAGYTPVRVMFYYPNREQAIRIQQTLETLYQGLGGRYYYGDAAWEFIRECTGVNLKQILEELAEEKTAQNGSTNI